MMFRVHLGCHLWDLEDEGVEDVLDGIQGELGAGGIAVVAAGRSVTQLRRHRHVHPRIFRSGGGFFFQPQTAHYTDTPYKPVVSEWLGARNPLAQLDQACRQRHMQLRALIDTRRLGRIATHYRAAAGQSAFGDRSPGCLCICNPDVVELLRALVGDLSSNYALTAIELRDLDRPLDSDLLESADTAGMLGPAGRQLFAVCFCESCLRSARQGDIDAEAARRSARGSLAGAIGSAGSLGDSLDELLADEPMLARYVEHQRAAHVSLLATLASATKCDLILRLSDGAMSDRVAAVAATSRYAAAVVPLRSPFTNEGTELFHNTLTSCRTHTNLRCEALLGLPEPIVADDAALVRAFKYLVDNSVEGVQLDHYGVMGDREFTAAKQAIRFARRSAP